MKLYYFTISYLEKRNSIVKWRGKYMTIKKIIIRIGNFYPLQPGYCDLYVHFSNIFKTPDQ
jgi:hypothetical protein